MFSFEFCEKIPLEDCFRVFKNNKKPSLIWTCLHDVDKLRSYMIKIILMIDHRSYYQINQWNVILTNHVWWCIKQLFYFSILSKANKWSSFGYYFPEAVIRRSSVNKLFLKSLQYSGLLHQKETSVQVLSSEYCEIFKCICFEEHLRTAASDFHKTSWKECVMNSV